MMLVKNYQIRTLIWLLPCRLILEGAAGVLAIKQRDYKRILAIFRAVLWNIFHLLLLMKARKQVNELRRLSDAEIQKRLFKKAVALQYYLFSKKTYHQLIGING